MIIIIDTSVIINKVNKYIDSNRPWSLAKDPAAREDLETILAAACEAIHRIALLVYPFIPSTAERIGNQLGLTVPIGNSSYADWVAFPTFPAGESIGDLEPLFPRIDDKTKVEERPKKAAE